MDPERYYTSLLLAARQRHRELVSEARPFTGFLREAVKYERQQWRNFAHSYITKLREARHGN